MESKETYKPLVYFFLVLILFYFSSLFQLIPIVLFNIDIKTCDDVTLNIVRLFPNLILAIILFFMYRKTLINDFKDFKNRFSEISDIAIKYWLLGFVLMIVSNSLIANLTPVKIAANEESIRGIISATPIISFILICLLAPFVEELIFRKSFKDVFKSKILFVILSGLVFGALHVIGSITSFYDFLYIFPYSILGIFFAIIYSETNNIYSTMFVHFLHNLLLLILNIVGFGVILL